MDTIKLVIWDLDDTFWKGTLSEEGITPIKDHIQLIKDLSKRGIVNSIASKNDFVLAKQKLQELKVWDYFIFPQINWHPKGNNIQQIIKSTQLRAENVLFIDDNHLNLAEVQFYNRNIWTKEPHFINKIQSHKAFKGKDDKALSRLNQYKILEEKEKEKQYYSDNTEFLETSKIQYSIIDDLDPIQDRILELINRTNQINYTKKRISINELNTLLTDSAYECKAIRVKDRFGEYGVVGFYALHKKNNKLEHFLFSCRSMNIGIEQYIYSILKFPDFDKVGDVTVELNKTDHPHWIKEVKDWSHKTIEKADSNSTKIFLKGACDLKQMAHYLSYKNVDVLTEFNDVNSNNHPVAKSSTEILVQSENISDHEKQNLVNNLPFLDENAFCSEVFSNQYDILVYSLLVDYTMDLFESKTTGLKIPYESYSDFPKETEKEFVERCSYHNFKSMDKNFYQYFISEYKFVGQISEEQLTLNLNSIRKKVSKPIIFINGAEVESPISNKSEYNIAKKRHTRMNKVLETFCKNHPNTYILDVRKFVNENDINHSIRHYKRTVYENMADELAAIVGEIKNQKLEKNIFLYSYLRSKEIIYHGIKKMAKHLLSKAALLSK